MPRDGPDDDVVEGQLPEVDRPILGSGVSADQWRGYALTMPTGDELKGRVKEAAGDLTDNDDLKREGKIDKGEGKVKDAVDSVGDKVKDLVDRDDDR